MPWGCGTGSVSDLSEKRDEGDEKDESRQRREGGSHDGGLDVGEGQFSE